MPLQPVKLARLPVTTFSSSKTNESSAFFKSFKTRQHIEVGSSNAAIHKVLVKNSKLYVVYQSKINRYDLNTSKPSASTPDSSSSSENTAIELPATIHFSKHKEAVTAITVREDSSDLVCSGDASGMIFVWSEKHGVLRRMQAHEGIVEDLLYLDVETVVSVGADFTVKVWDVTTVQCVSVFTLHQDRVKAVRKLLNGFVTIGYDGKVIGYQKKTSDGQYEVVFEQLHEGQLECLAVYPNQTGFITVSHQTAKTWTFQGIETGEFPIGHARTVTCIQVIDDFVYTGSLDGTVKVHDLSKNFEISHSYGFEKSVSSLFFQGNALFVGDEGGKVVLKERRIPNILLSSGLPAPTTDELGLTKLAQTGIEEFYKAGEKAKKESHLDFMLRKFEYGKILSMLVSGDSSSNILALSVLDELIQRNALHALLRNQKDEETHAQIIKFFDRVLLTYPAHSWIIVYSIEVFLELNMKYLEPSISSAMEKLKQKCLNEIAVQTELMKCLGSIETLLSCC
jgi:UTP15 C terminal/WD domain, G-beta repeat